MTRRLCGSDLVVDAGEMKCTLPPLCISRPSLRPSEDSDDLARFLVGRDLVVHCQDLLPGHFVNAVTATLPTLILPVQPRDRSKEKVNRDNGHLRR